VSVLRIGLVVAIVVAAAIAANVALLSLATGSREPVGRLSPVVAVSRGAPAYPAPSAPAKTQTEPPDHREADD
jgi:hypothetical protein